MHKTITEGSVTLQVPVAKTVDKQMPVFYNPVMKLNRDISVLLLNVLDKKQLQIALPLAGTGIRGLRFLKELSKNKLKNISFNDYSDKATALIKKNLKTNKIKNKDVTITNKDANLFLLESTGFDYIDIDPFGTPNPFLDSAIKRLARDGILAVTATDTAPLCGTFPKTCKRKYWAQPKRDYMMHETGLRILIRKVQLVASQYEKALLPIFSYSKDHYLRVFFRCTKGKQHCDALIKQHGMFNNAGPMWLGQLWDSKLSAKMYKECTAELKKFLAIIKEESKIAAVGFIDLHKLGGRLQKKESFIKQLRKQKHLAASTHFSGHGVRTTRSLF